jgi:hypothetical protein
MESVEESAYDRYGPRIFIISLQRWVIVTTQAFRMTVAGQFLMSVRPPGKKLRSTEENLLLYQSLLGTAVSLGDLRENHCITHGSHESKRWLFIPYYF